MAEPGGSGGVRWLVGIELLSVGASILVSLPERQSAAVTPATHNPLHRESAASCRQTPSEALLASPPR